MNMNIYEYYVSGRHAYVFPQDMLMSSRKTCLCLPARHAYVFPQDMLMYEDMLMSGRQMKHMSSRNVVPKHF